MYCLHVHVQDEDVTVKPVPPPQPVKPPPAPAPAAPPKPVAAPAPAAAAAAAASGAGKRKADVARPSQDVSAVVWISLSGGIVVSGVADGLKGPWVFKRDMLCLVPAGRETRAHGHATARLSCCSGRGRGS